MGIDDYLNSNNFVNGQHRVIVKIKSPTASYDDLYMMYNRKKGVNSEVIQHGDKVTIVSTSGLGQQSWLEAFITEDDVGGHHFMNWDGNGTDLVVEVCDRAFGVEDYAHVIVYMDDGVNNIVCSTASPTSKAAPTMLPTAPPTKMPSASPTKSPTASPTTSAPTTSPSPSFFPTVSPTSCTLEQSSCVQGFECCSGLCSQGQKSSRVCLPSTNPNCVSVLGTCMKDADCCSDSCSGGQASTRYCKEPT